MEMILKYIDENVATFRRQILQSIENYHQELLEQVISSQRQVTDNSLASTSTLNSFAEAFTPDNFPTSSTPNNRKALYSEVLSQGRHRRAAHSDPENVGNLEAKNYCGFCKKNGEMPAVFLSHLLKDENGFITCPILQKYHCRICGATGRLAHTNKYCPLQG